MNELIGPLGMPGALVALLTAGLVSVKLYQSLRPAHNSHARTDKALEQLTVALATVNTNVSTQTSVLQAVGLNLATLNERVAHAPTKDDLRQFAEQNRHDARGSLDTVLRAVEGSIATTCDAADQRDAALHKRLDVLPELVAARVR